MRRMGDARLYMRTRPGTLSLMPNASQAMSTQAGRARIATRRAIPRVASAMTNGARAVRITIAGSALKRKRGPRKLPSCQYRA